MRIRHMGLMACIVGLLLTRSVPVSGETLGANEYAAFVKAANRNDDAEALRLIAAAHELNPSNDLYTYWYGYELYQAERYEEAIAIILPLPTGYKGGYREWLLGDAYGKINRHDDAKRELASGLNVSTGDDLSRKLCLSMINVCIKTDDTVALTGLHERITKFLTGKDKHERYCLQGALSLYISEAADLYAAGLRQEADKYVDQAGDLCRIATLDSTSGLSTEWYEAFQYCRNDQVFKNPKTTYRSLWVFFTDVEIHDIDNKVISQSLSSSDIARYDGAFKAAKRMFFYLSSGTILLERDVVAIKEKTKIKVDTQQYGDNPARLYYAPVLTGEAGKTFIDNYNEYGVFTIVFPNRELQGLNYYQGGPLVFGSGSLRTNSSRVQIILPRFSDYMTTERHRASYALTHELFHSLEYIYGDSFPFKAHVWSQSREQWPTWYDGEKGEFGYYASAFRTIILPAGTKRLSAWYSKEKVDGKEFQKAIRE